MERTVSRDEGPGVWATELGWDWVNLGIYVGSWRSRRSRGVWRSRWIWGRVAVLPRVCDWGEESAPGLYSDGEGFPGFKGLGMVPRGSRMSLGKADFRLVI